VELFSRCAVAQRSRVALAIDAAKDRQRVREALKPSPLGLVSTISFIGAGVCAAAGLIAVLVGKPSTPSPASARVVPWIVPGGAGLSGTF
jgi:hypothetical protein